MPRVWIDEDEWWPVYTLTEEPEKREGCHQVELTDAEVRQIRRYTKSFRELQDMLVDKVEAVERA